MTHREEAEQFYQGLQQENTSVRVGMEASGHARWFERLLAELRRRGFERYGAVTPEPKNAAWEEREAGRELPSRRAAYI